MKSVNKTRPKERFLEYFKETREQSDGRNTLLVFKAGMCNMIQDALKKRDFLEDAIILAMQGCFNKEKHEGILFNGSFPKTCEDVTAIKSQDPHFLNSQWIQLEKPRETRVPSMPHYWPGHSL